MAHQPKTLQKRNGIASFNIGFQSTGNSAVLRLFWKRSWFSFEKLPELPSKELHMQGKCQNKTFSLADQFKQLW